ncbi:Metal dependent hydrolase - related [Entamoeba marina]
MDLQYTQSSFGYAEKLVKEEMNTILDDQLRNAPGYYYLKSVIKETLIKSGLENRIITVNSKNRFDEVISFIEEELHCKNHFLFVISPLGNDGKFKANAIRDYGFSNRKSFPKEWLGLEGEELVKVCGVKGAEFCHSGGFLISNKTYKSCFEMCLIACGKE